MIRRHTSLLIIIYYSGTPLCMFHRNCVYKTQGHFFVSLITIGNDRVKLLLHPPGALASDLLSPQPKPHTRIPPPPSLLLLPPSLIMSPPPQGPAPPGGGGGGGRYSAWKRVPTAGPATDKKKKEKKGGGGCPHIIL